MNKIHKIIWSKVRHCYVVVSEITKRDGKSVSLTGLLGRKAAVLAVMALCGVSTVLPTMLVRADNIYDYLPKYIDQDKNKPAPWDSAHTVSNEDYGAFGVLGRNWRVGFLMGLISGDTVSGKSDLAQELKHRTAIGNRFRVFGFGATAYGYGTNAVGEGSLAVGHAATTNGNEGTAIGYYAKVMKGQGTVVGAHSWANDQAVALGADVRAQGYASISIGSDDADPKAFTGSPFSDKLPEETIRKIYKDMIKDNPDWFKDKYIKDSTGNDRRVWSPNYAAGKASIAIGSRTVALGDASTSIGVLSMALADRSTALGVRSLVSSGAKGGMALGEESRVMSKNGLAVGNKTYSSGDGSLAYGYDAKALGANSIAIGHNVGANAMLNHEAQDTMANVLLYNGEGKIKPTGTSFDTTQNRIDYLEKVMNGYDKKNKQWVDDEGSVIRQWKDGNNGPYKTEYRKKQVQTGPKQWSDNAIAIGRRTYAIGNNSLVLGSLSLGAGNNSLNVGHLTYTKGENAAAIGMESAAIADNSMAIGVRSFANLTNSIAVGVGSKTDYTEKDLAQDAWAPRNAITFPSSTQVGVVSVGKIGSERRISNVAGGYRDTDAVNVSQLRSLEERLSSVLPEDSDLNPFSYLAVDKMNGDSNLVVPLQKKEMNYRKYVNYRIKQIELQVKEKNHEKIDETFKDRIKNVITNLENDTSNKTGVDNSGLRGKNVDTILQELKNAYPELNVKDTNDVINKLNEWKKGKLKDSLKKALTNDEQKFIESTNYLNDGAKGKDAIAVGYKAQSLADNSIAIGKDSHVDKGAQGGIALGALASATRAGGQRAYDFDKNTVYANDGDAGKGIGGIHANKSDTGALSIGSTNYTRQITNVAGGSEDTDAVNVAQLKQVNNKINGVDNKINGVDNKVTDVNTKVEGNIGFNIEGNTGGQPWVSAGTKASQKGKISLKIRGGDNDSNINVDLGRVTNDGFDTIEAKINLNHNLNSLESATFTKDGRTSTLNQDGLTIGSGKTAVALTKDGLNMGGHQIHGVTAGTAGTDAVNVTQMNTTIQATAEALKKNEIKTAQDTATAANSTATQANSTANTANSTANTAKLTAEQAKGAADKVNKELAAYKTEVTKNLNNKANTGLDNLTQSGKTVVKNLAKEQIDTTVTEDFVTGKVKKGSVTSKTLTVTGDGKVVSADLTLEIKDKAISKGKLSDELVKEIEGKATKDEVANKAEKTYVDNQLNTKVNTSDFDTYKGKVTTDLAGKADVDGGNITAPGKWAEKLGTGTVAENDTNLVTGGKVFAAIKDKADKSELTNKADKDAGNIGEAERTAWAGKLGTGAIADKDTNLVTGGKVYAAIKDKANTSLDNLTEQGKTKVKDLAGEKITETVTNTFVTDKVTKGSIKSDTLDVTGDGKAIGSDLTINIKDGSITKAKLNNDLKTEIEGKATKDEVANKAEKTYVDNQLNTKVNTSDFDTYKGKVTTDLAGKADVDGGNITAPGKWAEKLGTGAIAANDANLVTGKTVYDFVNPIETKATNNATAITKLQTGFTIKDAGTGTSNVTLGGDTAPAITFKAATANTENATSSFVASVDKNKNVTYTLNTKKLKEELGITGKGVGTMSSWKIQATGGTATNVADGETVEFGVSEADKGLTVTQTGKTIKYGIDAENLVKNINSATTKITNVNGDNIDLSKNASITNITKTGGLLDGKANKDATNIDATAKAKWAEKLGTGTIAANDTNLVTGGTVQAALKPVSEKADKNVKDIAGLTTRVGKNESDIQTLQGGFTLQDANKTVGKQTVTAGSTVKVTGDKYVTATVNDNGLTLGLNEATLNNQINTQITSNSTVTGKMSAWKLKATGDTAEQEIKDGNTVTFAVAEAGKGLTVSRDGNTIKYGIDGSKIDLTSNTSITNINTTLKSNKATVVAGDYVTVTKATDAETGNTFTVNGPQIEGGDNVTITDVKTGEKKVGYKISTKNTTLAAGTTGLSVDAGKLKLNVADTDGNAVTGEVDLKKLDLSENTSITTIKNNFTTGLNGKADKNAGNIGDTERTAWAGKLGTGTVTANDGNLVTGKTVYDFVNPIKTKSDTNETAITNLKTGFTIKDERTGTSNVTLGGDTAPAITFKAATANTENATSSFVASVDKNKNVTYTLNTKKLKEELGITGKGVGTMSSWKIQATGGTATNVADGETVEFGVSEADKGLTVTQTGKTIKYGIDAENLVKNINSATTKITNVNGDNIDLSKNASITNITKTGGLLDGKANKDATNIDATAKAKWAEKLGTGTIAENDTNLVTGGTVQAALKPVSDKANKNVKDIAGLTTRVGKNEGDIQTLQGGFTLQDANKTVGQQTVKAGSTVTVTGDDYIKTKVDTNGLTLSMNATKLNSQINDQITNNTTVTGKMSAWKLKATGVDGEGTVNNTDNTVTFDVAEAGKGLTVTRTANTIKYGIDGSKIDFSNNDTVKTISGNITNLQEGFTIQDEATPTAGKKVIKAKDTITFKGDSNITAAVGADGSVTYSLNKTGITNTLNDTFAKKDASNIGDTERTAWAGKLGTGTVTANDGNLVTGKTVYDFVNPIKTKSDTNETAITNLKTGFTIKDERTGTSNVTLGGDTAPAITFKAATANTENATSSFVASVDKNKNVTYTLNTKKLKEELGITGKGVGTMSSWKIQATGGTATNVADGETVEFGVSEADKGLTVTQTGKTIKYGIDAENLVKNINSATTKITNVAGDKIDISNNSAITNITKSDGLLSNKADKDATNIDDAAKVKWAEKLGTGKVAANDGNLVTGKTVKAELDKKVDTTTYTAGMATKADANGSNVTNPETWAEKLGTGTISATDGKLVTGKTVQAALKPVSDKANQNETNITTLQKGFTLKDANTTVGEQTVKAGSTVTVTGDDYIKTKVDTNGLTLSMDETKLNSQINTQITSNSTVTGKMSAWKLKATGDTAEQEIKDGNTVTFAVAEAGKGLTVSRDGNTIKYGIDGSKIDFSNNDMVKTINGNITNLQEGFTIQDEATPMPGKKVIKAKDTITFKSGANLTSKVGDDGSVTYGLNSALTNMNSITFAAPTTPTGETSKALTINGTAGTITGLTNTTWNVNSITSGRAATEDQLKALSETVSGNASSSTDYQLVKAGTTETKDGTEAYKADKDGNIDLLVQDKNHKKSIETITISDVASKFSLDTLKEEMKKNIQVGGKGADGADGVDGTIGVNGKDGKLGIGINGKDGGSITIHGTNGADGQDGQNGLTIRGVDGKNGEKGEKGVDGKDVNRIVTVDPNGTKHQLATLDDGLKFAGNVGNFYSKLNETVEIVGGVTIGEHEKAEDKLTDENIGVVAKKEEGKNGKLDIKLAKNLKNLSSATFTKTVKHGDKEETTSTVINDLGTTVTDKDGNTNKTTAGGTVIQTKDGKEKVEIKKDGITITDAGDSTLAHPGKTISLTKDGFDNGGNKITNIAKGMSDNDAATVGQVNAAKKEAMDTLTAGFDVKAGNVTGTVSLKAKEKPTVEFLSAGNGLSVDLTTDAKTHTQKITYRLSDTPVFGEKAVPGEAGNPGKPGKAGKDGKVEVIGKDGSAVVINGKDGSIGLNGKDGKDGIGINGKDGGSITIHGTNGADGQDGQNGLTIRGVDGKNGEKGEKGVDGTTTINRIVTVDPNGTTHQVATLDDGLKFAGDSGDAIAKKLNETVTISGGVTDETKLSDNNVGVVAKDGKLNVKLAKNLTGLESATFTNKDGNTNQTTAGGTVIQNKDGTEKVEIKKDGITITDGPAANPKKKISLTKDGFDNGGNKITNIADGDISKDSKDAVNGGQLFAAKKEMMNTLTAGFDVKAGNVTGTVSLKAKEKPTVEFLSAGNGLSVDLTTDAKTHTQKITYRLSDTPVFGEKAEPGEAGKPGKDGKDGKVEVVGKDGSSVVINGKDGSIGLNGTNGQNGLTIRGVDGKTGEKGEKGVDGKDINRIVTVDPNGTKHQLATLDDGLKFAGDSGDAIAKKLNETVTISGGVTDETKLSDNNIGVVAKDGKLNVKLAKNLTGLESATFTDKDGNTNQTTADGTVVQNKDGTEKVEIKKDGITIMDAGDGTLAHPGKTISLTKDGFDNGGNKITNIADGESNSDAATVGQVEKAKTELTTAINNKADYALAKSDGQDGAYKVTDGKITLKVKNKAKPDEAAEDVVIDDVASKSSLDTLKEDMSKLVNGMNFGVAKLDNKINRVGSGAAALAALKPLEFDPEDKWDVAVGYGNYMGANSLALGAFYRPNENTMFSLGGSFGDGENIINVGLSMKVGKGIQRFISKAEMANRIVEQDAEIAQLKAKDAQREAEIKALREKDEQRELQMKEILKKLNMA